MKSLFLSLTVGLLVVLTPKTALSAALPTVLTADGVYQLNHMGYVPAKIQLGSVLGSLAIGSGAGIHPKYVAKGIYDVSLNRGSVGTLAIGALIPAKAIITACNTDTITNPAALGASTIGFSIVSPGDVVASRSSSLYNLVQAGVPAGSSVGSYIKLTTAHQLTASLGIASLASGKIVVECEYFVSE